MELHRTRIAPLKDYRRDLQKSYFFSISHLWSLWRPLGHSESICMVSPGITDTQRHCQTRTSGTDTAILVSDGALDPSARARISYRPLWPSPTGAAAVTPSCSSCQLDPMRRRSLKLVYLHRWFVSDNPAGYL